jgi:hypothetical protein
MVESPMTDTFGRVKKLRKRLKKLSDEDLIVLDSAVAFLSSAAVLGDSSDSIFEEEKETDWAFLDSAERSITQILSADDIDWKRRDFWHKMNVLGFFDSDYMDSSPPPALLRRLVEMSSKAFGECVDLMLHDDLVKVWIEVDFESRREGVLPDRSKSTKAFYSAERLVLKMQEKAGDKLPVVIDDWWKVARVDLRDEVNVVVTEVKHDIEIDGGRCHVMGRDAKHIVEKFGLKDLYEPRIKLDYVERVLKGS